MRLIPFCNLTVPCHTIRWSSRITASEETCLELTEIHVWQAPNQQEIHSHIQRVLLSFRAHLWEDLLRKCLSLPQCQEAYSFHLVSKGKHKPYHHCLCFMCVFSTEWMAEYGSASNDVWRTLGPWTTNTALSSQDSLTSIVPTFIRD